MTSIDLAFAERPVLPWPLHPPPIEDETTLSWLSRIAHRNGVDLHSLIQDAFPSKNVLKMHLVRRIPAWVQAELAIKTVLPPDRVEATSLKGYEGRLFECGGWNDGRMDWLLSLGGQPFCPECLATDPIPFLRRHWSMAFVTTCAVHGHRHLLHTCSKCGMVQDLALSPERSFRHRGPLPVWVCRRCGFDLREGRRFGHLRPPKLPPALLQAGRDLQDQMVQALLLGWAELPGTGPGYSHLFFDGVRQIAKMVALKSVAMNLKKVIRHRLKLTSCALPFQPWAKGSSFEGLNVRDRMWIMAVVGWLIQDWPDRFLDVCREAKIGSRALTMERNKPLPYWLATVVRSGLFAGYSRWRDPALPKQKQYSYAALAQRRGSNWLADRERRILFIQSHPELWDDPRALSYAMRDAKLYAATVDAHAIRHRLPRLLEAAQKQDEWWRRAGVVPLIPKGGP